MKMHVKKPSVKTHEGATAQRVNPTLQLRRSVMACMLWEDQFYENGVSIAQRISEEIKACDKAKVAEIAIEARTRMKLRHIPLLLCRELARLGELKAETLTAVIQRPDEISEFMSLYWKDGKCPIAKSVKKGLRVAFNKFNEYSLSKWNQDGAIKLRDVAMLVHAKPSDAEHGTLLAKLLNKEFFPERTKSSKFPVKEAYGLGDYERLKVPDTWEVELSASKDKLASWEWLLKEDKLGAMALLRNLRNMKEAGVADELVIESLRRMKSERVLPFRFISAARHAPHLEPELETAMLRCLESYEKLPGKTAIVVDNSGSMEGAKVSAKSEIDRADAACALAMLVRELAERCVVVGFSTEAAVIPARRGFALRDAIRSGPGGGTNTRIALQLAAQEGYNRIIVITDEQSHQVIGPPATGTRGYFINVASAQNGIGYGAWTHIDGWSEAVIDYIREFEREE